MLRPRSAARQRRCVDLLLRVHLLPILRARCARREVHQLRRRAGCASAASGEQAREEPSLEGPCSQTWRMREEPLARRGWRSLWPLLFAVTYLVHIAEELCGGFVPWSNRFLGFHLTVERFLGLNGVAWVGMLVLGIAASIGEKTRWLVVPLATAVLLNGLAHLGASIVTRTY